MTDMEATTALDQTPPSSVEAEEAVLGSILINPEALFEVASFLQTTDFFIARHMWIWDTIMTIQERGQAIDNLTVMIELRQRGQLQDAGGPAYITYLINSTPTHIHASTYGRIVQAAAIRRRLLNAAANIAQLALEKNAAIEDVCDQAEGFLFNATETGDKQAGKSLREALSIYFDKVEYLYQNPDQPPGIPTGYPELDALTLGLHKSDLTYVAGRPGMGKSALLQSIAMNVAKLGKRIAMFSMEMSIDQVVERLVAMETGINGTTLRGGRLNEKEWGLFVEALSTDRMGKLNIFLEDMAQLSIRQLGAKCRRMYREHGLDLIIVDYVQLMCTESNEDNRNLEISKISRGLKVLAMELNVPVLAAAQLSRDVEKRSNKRPMLSDLRDSGSLEQDANNVIFLYRDVVYNDNTENPNSAEIIVSKQRSGATGTVKLLYDAPRTQFLNPRRSLGGN